MATPLGKLGVSAMNKTEISEEGDSDIVITRSFEAPINLLFEALTEPAQLKRWLKGPDGWGLEKCEGDLRVGGNYCYVWKHEDGRETELSGTYCEIAPPHRIIQTERSDWNVGETVNRA